MPDPMLKVRRLLPHTAAGTPVLLRRWAPATFVVRATKIATLDKFKVASLNSNGLPDRNQMSEIRNKMLKDDVAVLALQDTHIDAERAREYADIYNEIENMPFLQELKDQVQ